MWNKNDAQISRKYKSLSNEQIVKEDKEWIVHPGFVGKVARLEGWPFCNWLKSPGEKTQQMSIHRKWHQIILP